VGKNSDLNNVYSVLDTARRKGSGSAFFINNKELLATNYPMVHVSKGIAMKRAPEGSGQAMRVSSHKGGNDCNGEFPRIKFGAGYVAKKSITNTSLVCS